MVAEERIITHTYRHADYIIDIVEDYRERLFEAYIQKDGYGVKDLMFGCSIDDFPKKIDFIDLVAYNIEEYILTYEKEHCDEEEGV